MIRLPPTVSAEALEQAKAGVQTARFERQWGYIFCGILSWVLFWNMAERYQDRPHTQLLSWLAVFVAILVVGYV